MKIMFQHQAEGPLANTKMLFTVAKGFSLRSTKHQL
jgi:hypothetical protein